MLRVRPWLRRLSVLALLAACVTPGLHAETPAAPSYVGAQVCAGCHSTETKDWLTTHHAKAMQPATPATVLGDFADARFEQGGVTTIFSRAGDIFRVRTQGKDGGIADFDIAYTFGVYPLQQYLIALPGGRLQAFGIAWDSRAKDQGGQRWYALYPDQTLPPGDRLHWTGRDQTWNYMCADCHSTGLRKNFDLAADRYATRWTDPSVACEACHGPGSRHVEIAQAKTARLSPSDRMGIANWLKATDNGHWEMTPATGIAHRTEPLVSTELDTCAACHARRKVIARNPAPGTPFLDAYLPAYLEPGLYYPDGQIDGEVFEYGSFLQSRMHHAGVTCTNCHEPHGRKLVAEGGALCAQCHAPEKFATPVHHHHASDTTGAQCVSCHMTTHTYMGVDVRHDHSFRVPRPDLSLSIGTPNACTQCHAGKSDEWAAGQVAAWFPGGRQTSGHYGLALAAGRTGAADAEQQLDRLILDPAQPAIARGSALLLLPAYATPASAAAIAAAATDPDPLVRAAVPRAIPAPAPPAFIATIAPLLADPFRAVRIEAARALLGTDPQALKPEQRSALATAYLELVAAEMVDADRPEAHLNLGLLEIRRNQPDRADAEYRTALRLDPRFVPALANLADLERMRGHDAEGAALLRQAIALEPGNAAAHHALGLLFVRQHEYPAALGELRQAQELAPGNTRYAYVYAVALNATGDAPQAIALLERTRRAAPSDITILGTLVALTRDAGDVPAALRYARDLLALRPGDAQLRRLIQELEAGPPARPGPRQ